MPIKKEYDEKKICEDILRYPNKSISEIGRENNLSHSMIKVIMKRNGILRITNTVKI